LFSDSDIIALRVDIDIATLQAEVVQAKMDLKRKQDRISDLQEKLKAKKQRDIGSSVATPDGHGATPERHGAATPDGQC